MEKEVLENLLMIKPLINGKKWLDIGTRNGLNMISLTKCGATSVIGIDIIIVIASNLLGFLV